MTSSRFVCLLLALVACGGARTARAADGFDAIKADVVKLKAERPRETQREPYERLIERMTAFAASAPRSDRADDALFVAAKLRADIYDVSRVDADRATAIDAFVLVATKHPKSNLADDAWVAAAELSTDSKQARAFLNRAASMRGADLADVARGKLVALATRPDDGEATATDAHVDTDALPRADVLPDRPAAGTPPRRILAIEREQRAGEHRVRVKLSGDVGVIRGEVPSTEGAPRRIYFDLAPMRLGQKSIAPVDVNDGVIKRVRAGQYDAEVVRLVVELQGDVEPLLTIKQKPFEIVLSSGAPPVVVAAKPEAKPEPKPEAKAEAKEPLEGLKAEPVKTEHIIEKALEKPVEEKIADKPVLAILQEKQAEKREENAADKKEQREEKKVGQRFDAASSGQLKLHRIVLDAGHGGIDTGAVGPSGVREKDVTLALVKRVRDRIRQEMPNVDVILTRSDDSTLALQDRTTAANQAKADLFISIHCNASPARRVRGVETYYLNITHDRYSMRLASRENTETGKPSISDLDYILADLAMKSNVDDSIRLGRQVQSSIMKKLKMRWSDVPDLGLKHALFYVLMGNHMPSILVESSFLSNGVEEQRLNSDAYQDAIADGVVQGVRRFVEERQAFYAGK